jgi:hypothetical protein
MNRSYSKIRHIQETNQRLEKRLMTEKYQINENIESDFNLSIDEFVTDPKVKKVLDGILDCAMAQPLKAFDYLRVVTNLFGLIFGEPSESSEASFERYNQSREDSIEKLKQLINPCRSVTVEEIKSVLTSPELKNFILSIKNKFQ